MHVGSVSSTPKAQRTPSSSSWLRQAQPGGVVPDAGEQGHVGSCRGEP